MKLLRALVLIAVAVYGLHQYTATSHSSSRSRTRSEQTQSAQVDQRNHFQTRGWVSGSGTVVKTLKDDLNPPRHQRFLIDIGNDHTILVAHNIDLAPRIPVTVGDTVDFRGEFIPTDKGGTLHWTHHDPSGRKAGGFIRLNGKDFR